MYVIIKDKYATLKKIVEWSKKKYGEVFSERMFLEQLTYLGDLQFDEKLIFLGEQKITIKELSAFFQQEVFLLG